MKNFRKSIFSILLTLILTCGMLLPAGILEPAFGATTRCGISADWKQWTSSTKLPTSTGYYYLSKDVTLSSIQVPDKNANIYLDLNGKGVSKQNKLTGSYQLDNASTVRLYNSSSTGGSIFSSPFDDGGFACVWLNNSGAKLYLESGTICNTVNQFYGAGVCVSQGSFYMNGEK